MFAKLFDQTIEINFDEQGIVGMSFVDNIDCSQAFSVKYGDGKINQLS